jgi:hypothetical protein
LSILALLDRDQVEDFERGLLVGEMAAVADGAAEARVQRLDRVGGVDDLAQLKRKLGVDPVRLTP